MNRLLRDDFKTTEHERRRISYFLEAPPCDLGSGLHLVGYPPELPDRKVVRVLGPGALV